MAEGDFVCWRCGGEFSSHKELIEHQMTCKPRRGLRQIFCQQRRCR